MTKEELKELLFIAIKSAYKGGLEILDVYDSEFAVELKDDNSPLTAADSKAHLAIMDGLLPTKIPVLSEEGKSIPFEERSAWANLWIVDPLDGTKEFIKRNGEFTVNIALINEGKPVIGVIYVPVSKVMYFGLMGEGSYKIEHYDELDGAKNMEILFEAGKELPLDQEERPYTVVGSRSHMSVETEEFINKAKAEYGEVDIISKGSSLKLCMVAEGIADAYPRFAPTMEWDTAAGQGIVNAMGGQVIDQTTKGPMVYNRENLLNNWFLVTK
jgi:3'(2'), 5'-bisphosphate nucleotidase